MVWVHEKNLYSLSKQLGFKKASNYSTWIGHFDCSKFNAFNLSVELNLWSIRRTRDQKFIYLRRLGQAVWKLTCV